MYLKRLLMLLCFCINITLAKSYIITTDSIPENNIAGESGIHIIFPCNKIYFDNNQESWIKLNLDIDSLLKDSTIIIKAIHLYGAASPEGPYNNNIYLSINRTKRVMNALQENFPSLDSNIINFYNIPEDYERMLYVTKDDSLYQNLSEYIGKDDFETKKNLQKNKKLWKDLLNRYFPGLRAVNIIIYINKKPIIKKIIPKPQLSIDLNTPEVVLNLNKYNFYYIRQPMLRIKSNIIYDACLIPNCAIEFLPIRGHITPEFRIMWSGWRNDNIYKTLIIHAYEAGIRYYLSKSSYTGFFTNIAIGLGKYDTQTSKNRGFLSKKYLYNNKFEIGCGYVWRIKNNWTIETTLGLGCIYSRYNKYHGAEDWATPGEFYFNWHNPPEDFIKYNHKTRWIGPVNVGVSISYDILHYRTKCVTL